METNIVYYIAVMAGTTYLIRVMPFLLIKKPINNRFIKSFLFYVPYAALTAMVIPGIFYATGNYISASLGFITAVALSWANRGLVTVALAASLAVFLTELLLKM